MSSSDESVRSGDASLLSDGQLLLAFDDLSEEKQDEFERILVEYDVNVEKRIGQLRQETEIKKSKTRALFRTDVMSLPRHVRQSKVEDVVLLEPKPVRELSNVKEEVEARVRSMLMDLNFNNTPPKRSKAAKAALTAPAAAFQSPRRLRPRAPQLQTSRTTATSQPRARTATSSQLRSAAPRPRPAAPRPRAVTALPRAAGSQPRAPRAATVRKGPSTPRVLTSRLKSAMKRCSPNNRRRSILTRSACVRFECEETTQKQISKTLPVVTVENTPSALSRSIASKKITASTPIASVNVADSSLKYTPISRPATSDKKASLRHKRVY